MALRCDGRDQAHAMSSAACYDNGCFAFLAPATPGMMIRADMSRVTKIDVCTLALSHFLDLRIFRLQPFLDQRLVAFHRTTVFCGVIPSWASRRPTEFAASRMPYLSLI